MLILIFSCLRDIFGFNFWVTIVDSRPDASQLCIIIVDNKTIFKGKINCKCFCDIKRLISHFLPYGDLKAQAHPNIVWNNCHCKHWSKLIIYSLMSTNEFCFANSYSCCKCLYWKWCCNATIVRTPQSLCPKCAPPWQPHYFMGTHFKMLKQ